MMTGNEEYYSEYRFNSSNKMGECKSLKQIFQVDKFNGCKDGLVLLEHIILT